MSEEYSDCCGAEVVGADKDHICSSCREHCEAVSEAENNAKPFVKTIRRKTGLIEHVCKHGVGHPAYASVHFMRLNGVEGMGVHGCDGCCLAVDWQLASLQQSVEIANRIIVKQRDILRKLWKRFEELSGQ